MRGTIKNVYDLMAVLCHLICKLKRGNQEKLYRMYWADPEAAKRSIEEQFSFLDRKNIEGSRRFDFLSFAQINQIIEAIVACEKCEDDKKLLLNMLVYLDQYIDFEDNLDILIKDMDSPADHVYSFSPLNNNADSVGGMLLPRFTPSWEKGGSRGSKALTEDPLSVMVNYLWVPKVEGWQVNNIYSNGWNLKKGLPYTIVCSPLTNISPFEYKIEKTDECYHFYITSYDESAEAIIRERVEKTLKVASNKGASVVLFPEMLASPECQKACQEDVQNGWEYSYPGIICLPTCEFFDDNKKWKNQVKIINDAGKRIAEYNKQHPFQLDKELQGDGETGKKLVTVKCFEPIEADHTITIIHVKGVGRIGIMICADIFDEELCDILFKRYEIRLLLVMAYSQGYDSFFRGLSKAQSTFCDIVWCNTCAAYTADNKEHPVVAYISNGHRARNENIIKSCRDRGKLCKGCIATITIDPEYTDPGLLEVDRIQ